MSDVVVACVRVGGKYPFEYVAKLQRAVKRHLPMPHRFVCLTDRHFLNLDIGCVMVTTPDLPGWWSKMFLFDPTWRRGKTIIYLDLDTVIVGDMTPLAAIAQQHPFTVCENFTKAAGHPNWPCAYGSCVMTLRHDLSGDTWRRFAEDRARIMQDCGRYGDQLAIERLLPDAPLLQGLLPEGFFVGRRELSAHSKVPPPNAGMVIFAGSAKPHNSTIRWVREAWR